MVYRDVRILKTAALSPIEVVSKTIAAEEYTVTGLGLDKSRDVLIAVIKPTTDVSLGMVGWCISADDKIKINWINVSVGNLTPTASEVYTLVVGRTGSDPTVDGDRL